MPREFCWAELMTTAAEDAKAFYAHVFGWQATAGIIADDASYATMRVGDEAVCGLFQMADSLKAQRVPPYWMVHVDVADASVAVARAVAGGGRILSQPFAMGDAGRMAMLQDPSGALLNVWEKSPGALTLSGSAMGRPVWFELATSDLDEVVRFYGDLFGWKVKHADQGEMRYTTLVSAADQPVAAMLELPLEWRRIPSHWLPYFAVRDCAATATRVVAAGGVVMREATANDDHGCFAVFRDPQAAVFGVIEEPCEQ